MTSFLKPNQFDTSTEAIKRKNRISDHSEIWMGRVILVPERKGKINFW